MQLTGMQRPWKQTLVGYPLDQEIAKWANIVNLIIDNRN